jgi:eukaryotic-like serine/threonine-protein kinase
VLYEMATGKLPFQGSTSAVIFHAILGDTPTPPTRLNPGTSTELERIIGKALEKDPKLRCQSAAELLADLMRLKRDTDSSRTAVAGLAVEAPRQPWWRSKVALGVAGFVLIAVLAGAGWYYRSARAGSETIDSVAVLPFVNASADPNTEYLSDGITESLINSLSQLPHLKVMSRDSAFMYKGKDIDAHTVGQALGVRAVLKGRVMQHGDDLQISAELVDARDDSHIWGQQYSRKASEIFALQNDLAKEMTSMLRMRLTGEDEKRMDQSYTTNPEAYQLYLQGRFWWNKRTEEGFRKGIEYFQQAITKDPNYALAYAGLADSFSLLSDYGLVAPREAFPRAQVAALKSLEIQSNLAEAHASLAFIKTHYDWDRSGGLLEFQRAVELNPAYAISHQWYGVALWQMGQLREAKAEYERALELDPISLVINRNLGWLLYLARQYDQSVEQLRKTLEMDPSFVLAHNDLAQPYLQKSLYVEGIAECEKELVNSHNNAWALAQLGYAYAVAGRRAEAQNVLRQLNALSKEKYVSPIAAAQIYSGLGERDKTFEWLEKGYEDRSTGSTFVNVKVDPIWDPLRSDPRFADLLRRMNLQP